MLHATLEDFLRSLLISASQTFTSEQIDNYPLLGDNRKQAQKFSLGSLQKHRALSVAELIEKSVVEHISEFATFNNIGDVKKALKTAGIEPHLVDAHNYGKVSEMIKRRHKIVHHGDQNAAGRGQGNHRVNTLLRSNVVAFLDDVTFVRDLCWDNWPDEWEW